MCSVLEQTQVAIETYIIAVMVYYGVDKVLLLKLNVEASQLSPK